jgi:hypothetical protein
VSAQAGTATETQASAALAAETKASPVTKTGLGT